MPQADAISRAFSISTILSSRSRPGDLTARATAKLILYLTVGPSQIEVMLEESDFRLGTVELI